MKDESNGERMNEGMDRYCSPGNNGNEKTLCMRVPVTNCTTLSLAVCSVLIFSLGFTFRINPGKLWMGMAFAQARWPRNLWALLQSHVMSCPLDRQQGIL